MKKGALLLGSCACFLIFALLCFPAEMLAASAKGVQLWLTKVFPSLFPFLVACGILLRIGAAQRMGAALRPLMQPLFHLPGIAAFPFFFGLLSGYPMGAKLTAQLYEQRQLSLADAQQLLAFAHKAVRSALLPWGIRKEVRKRRRGRRRYPAGETRAASEAAEAAQPIRCAAPMRSRIRRQPETEQGGDSCQRDYAFCGKRRAFSRKAKQGKNREKAGHSCPTTKPPFSCNPSHKIKKPRKSEFFFGFSCLILFYAVGQRMTRGFVKS